MHVRIVRLPHNLADRLEAQEDLENSLTRILDPQAEWMDHDEVKQALDLDKPA